jgi:protein-tyrosine phosphatase
VNCDASKLAGQPLATKTVLFLCTGNYYRSRFAEILFNRLVEGTSLRWRAVSRGLAPDKGTNVGPISKHAIAGLRSRGIRLDDKIRDPLPVAEVDLAGADWIVAVKEAEHRPMMTARFPRWAERVDYWHIDDLDAAEPAEALEHLEREVRLLIGRLQCRKGVA